MEQTLEQYLTDRPWYQLRRLQQALKCRVEGDTRRHKDLQASILRHAALTGLTREQARILAETAAAPRAGGPPRPQKETSMMTQPITGMSRPFQHGTRIYATEILACGHPGQRGYPPAIQQRIAQGVRRRCPQCAAPHPGEKIPINP